MGRLAVPVADDPITGSKEQQPLVALLRVRAVPTALNHLAPQAGPGRTSRSVAH